MNDRRRQKYKALRMWARNAKHSDGPLLPSMLAAEILNVVVESVKRDYERSKVEPPVIWSESIRQMAVWGTIDTEVKW